MVLLYVTDQSANQINIIDNNRQLVGTVPTGPVPSGVTFGPDGFLYYTDTPFTTTDYIGRLVRVDPVSFQQSVVFDNLPFPTDVEFASDGSFYLATFLGQQIDHYSADYVLLDSFFDGVAKDQLAYYAPAAMPEPSPLALAGVGVLGYAWRRAKKSMPNRRRQRAEPT